MGRVPNPAGATAAAEGFGSALGEAAPARDMTWPPRVTTDRRRASVAAAVARTAAATTEGSRGGTKHPRHPARSIVVVSVCVFFIASGGIVNRSACRAGDAVGAWHAAGETYAPATLPTVASAVDRG